MQRAAWALACVCAVAVGGCGDGSGPAVRYADVRVDELTLAAAGSVVELTADDVLVATAVPAEPYGDGSRLLRFVPTDDEPDAGLTTLLAGPEAAARRAIPRAAPPPVTTSRYVEGATEFFYVGNLSSVRRTFVLRATGQRCYLFVEPICPYDPARLEELAAWFDQTYDHLTRELAPAPDVDGDPRVILALAGLGATDGFFYGGDQEPPSAAHPTTNQRDILYINAAACAPNATAAQGVQQRYVIAHEFTHMLAYAARGVPDVPEEYWDPPIDTVMYRVESEGLASMVPSLVGLGLADGLPACFTHAETFLTDGFGRPDLSYEYGYMLASYFHGRYGTAGLRRLLANPRELFGLPNYAAAADLTTAELMADWALASLLDGLTPEPRFNYQGMDLRGDGGGQYPGVLPGLAPSVVFANEEGIEATLGSYEAFYGRVEQPGNYRLSLRPGEGDLSARLFRVRVTSQGPGQGQVVVE